MTTTLTTTSTLERVVVYARGAQITRRVALPEAPLPESALTLVVSGVSAAAEPGSLRATVGGDRAVRGLRLERITPQGPPERTELHEDVVRLEREVEHARALERELTQRQDALHTIQPQPALLREEPDHASLDPSVQMRHAIGIDTMLDSLQRDLDEALVELEDTIARLDRELLDARLRHAQHSRAPGTATVTTQPTCNVRVHVAPGAQSLDALRITYTVQAARWWPVYAVRIDRATDTARLSMEAHVAQDTLEDWSDVALALSAGDMIRDQRLPELPSLRLGRARTPEPPVGFRAPPQGRERLFASYDAFTRHKAPSLAPSKPTMTLDTLSSEAPGGATTRWAALGEVQASAYDKGDRFEDGLALDDDFDEAPVPEIAYDMVPQPKSAGFGGMLARRAARAPAPASIAKAKKRELSRGGGGGGRSERERADAGAPAGADLTEDWLNFDALHLPDPARPSDGHVRGRLIVERDAVPGVVAGKADALEAAAPPSAAQDPREHRGVFEHVFEAQGEVSIPAHGRAERVHVQTRACPVKTAWRAVPAEVAEVYREALLTNPFGGPLLGGPIDVFIDGALVATSQLDAVDRGGELRFGLGVEERLRVARNVRTREASEGLLKGTTAIEHDVSIELASALSERAVVEVLDRVPITHDRDITVELSGSKPPEQPYDQSERGVPIEGAKRWTVSINPGGRAEITYRYVVRLPAKYTLQGGHRRDP